MELTGEVEVKETTTKVIASSPVQSMEIFTSEHTTYLCLRPEEGRAVTIHFRESRTDPMSKDAQSFKPKMEALWLELEDLVKRIAAEDGIAVE